MKNLMAALLLLLTLPYIYGIDYYNMPDDELVELAESGESEAQYQLGLLVEDLEYKKERQRLNYINRNKFYWFEQAAKQNHPESQTRIAKEYLSNYGYYKEENFNKAIELLKIAANSENREAALLLSIIYFHGLNGSVDKEISKNFLSESQYDFYRIKPMLYLEKELVEMIRVLVKEKNKEALFILGDLYYFGKTEYYEQNYKKAYRLYTQSAELENSSASYMIGMMLYNGVGTLKDLTESYLWINKSATAGNNSAIIKAGIMNYFGEGTASNPEEAMKWLTISANDNDSLSQYFLGVMYYKGEGTAPDTTLAKKWIKKAYENGSDSAKKFWDSRELWKN